MSLGRGGLNTRYGILRKWGSGGMDTHYGEAFKTTGFTTGIVIRSGHNSVTHLIDGRTGQSRGHIGPMSVEAEFTFETAAPAL